MFYSQFILAKKGPLGTIWIAAHLERKLRKNQVADTDIGVSVDSILFPDVPIALRLSSHLLLGVVRIYNRKVNYLFDDCSDALLKVKQAFRSTAVDLPPEESKAPYHSITLPETFDLDDFEMPDNDIFQGNYHDHHISSREQITLQDNMEGVSYSTSKFGLDERFGDGDASGLDLDEELLLGSVGAAGNINESSGPHASATSMSAKQDGHPDDRGAAHEENMVGDVDGYNDHMDYAEGPSTPGLLEEPNISNVQEASACDDQMELEYHLESNAKDNPKDTSLEDKQKEHWGPHDGTVPQEMPEENACRSVVLEIQESTPRGESPSNVTECISLKEPSSVPEIGQVEAINSIFESADTLTKASDVPSMEYSENEAAKEVNYYHSSDELAKESGLENSGLASTFQQVSERIAVVDPLSAEKNGSVDDANVQQKLSPNESELTSENQFGTSIETTETQALRRCTGSSIVNHDVHDNEAIITEPSTLRPCTTVLEQSGKDVYVTGNSDRDQGQESVSVEIHHVAFNEVAGQVINTNIQDDLVDNVNVSADAELSAPEKLLSVPEGHSNLQGNMLEEFSPRVFQGHDEGDAGSKTFTGKKRTFTESTLTEQSLYSAESSRQVRVKRTIDSVPDDNDLLSSILVGRKSSLFKVKPTPRVSEVTSMKRARSTPRSTAPKRKLVIDDTMVLHGDTIRQQLTSTENIRRVRKKAPCTCSEISMIQKQHLEDQIFLETVFTGTSVQLASLHSQEYYLRRINICQNKENGPDIEVSADPVVPIETVIEPKVVDNNDTSIGTVGYPAVERAEGPEVTGEREESRMEDKEHLSANDNEMIEQRENPVLSEIRMEEVQCTSTEVNAGQEKINDPEISVQEHFSDAAELGTSSLNVDAGDPSSIAGTVSLEPTAHGTDDTAAASDLVHIAALDETAEINYYVTMDASDQQTDMPSVELETANVNDGRTTGIDGVSEKDYDVNGECETEHGARDILANMDLNAGDAELGPNIEHGELGYEVLSEIYTAPPEEQSMQTSVLEDGFMRNGEESIYPEGFQPNMMGADISGYDLHEGDELNYSATGNDTEFLNFDDDDMNEMADDDDDMPEGGETRITENSGWSSRTRAVSKYLQASFIKEAAYGSKSLSMDNLLSGKTRKEASRMFFETLVLKTRDYIHVEQPHAFDDITLKPRAKLMKSDF